MNPPCAFQQCQSGHQLNKQKRFTCFRIDLIITAPFVIQVDKYILLLAIWIFRDKKSDKSVRSDRNKRLVFRIITVQKLKVRVI